MTNNAVPDQLATDLDLHYLQRQGISGLSKTSVNACHAGLKFQQKTHCNKLLIFPQKTGLTFHAMETVCMKCQSLFPRKVRIKAPQA